MDCINCKVLSLFCFFSRIHYMLSQQTIFPHTSASLARWSDTTIKPDQIGLLWSSFEQAPERHASGAFAFLKGGQEAFMMALSRSNKARPLWDSGEQRKLAWLLGMPSTAQPVTGPATSFGDDAAGIALQCFRCRWRVGCRTPQKETNAKALQCYIQCCLTSPLL